MKYSTYQYGIRGIKWGIWDEKEGRFVFDICEDTPMLANARLHQKIGDDAKKWRYGIKRLPKRRRNYASKKVYNVV